MATVDVTYLGRETLAPAAFPVPRQSDFRVAFAEPVHRGVNAHANADTSVEICGVLVGSWAKDADGPYAVIEHYIRCNAATQKFAEVTFTHDSWAQINQEMDTKYQDLRIIGWYHSHPNFGIFLSDRDCFIQENFFSGPGQIAFVVDPVRKLEGLFEWRQGKPVPMHHYWVGSRVQVGETQPAPPPAAMISAVPEQGYAPGSVPDSWSLALTVLLGLCTALLGFLWGARRTDIEQRRLEAGAVAHYGIWKLYKPGFEENFTKAIRLQNEVFREMLKLSQDHVAGAGEKQADIQKQWDRVYQGIDNGTKFQLLILEEYGLSETERAEIRELLAIKQEELQTKTLAPTPKVSVKPAKEKESADAEAEGQKKPEKQPSEKKAPEQTPAAKSTTKEPVKKTAPPQPESTTPSASPAEPPPPEPGQPST